VILVLSTLSTIARCLVIDKTKQRVLFFKEIKQETGQSLSDELSKVLTELLKEADLELKDFHAIYVFTGPGAFTGLRIGVNFARGLAMAAKIPLLGLPTSLISEEDFFIPMRPLIAREMDANELLESKMEFLRISQDGSSDLEKPNRNSSIKGTKENWIWPSDQEVLAALGKSSSENQAIDINYGINPKISGKVAAR